MTLDVAKVNRGEQNFDALEDIISGNTTVTTPAGVERLSVQQALSLITQGNPVAYDSGTTYTELSDWVTQGGATYRPLPDELPIGPEAFDSNKWVFHQNQADIDQNTADIATNVSDIAANLLATKQKGIFLWDSAITYDDGAYVTYNINITDSTSGQELDFEIYQNRSGATSLNDTPSENSAIWKRVTTRSNTQTHSHSARTNATTTYTNLDGGQGTVSLQANYIYLIKGMYTFDGATAVNTGVDFQIDFESGNLFYGVLKANVGASTDTRIVNANGGTQTAAIDITAAQATTGGGDIHIEINGHVRVANAVSSLIPEFAISSDGTGTLTALYGTMEAVVSATEDNYLEI